MMALMLSASVFSSLRNCYLLSWSLANGLLRIRYSANECARVSWISRFFLLAFITIELFFSSLSFTDNIVS
uniref:Uncharacterized protein n=1 Tax=Anopheles darlingi TaxID=43151 RepID=A0A2M4D6G9_ANODA